MLYAIGALIAIIADQWMKYWAATNIDFETGVVSLIPGFLSIVNIHNEGAAFSFLAGSNARMLFIIIAVAFSALVIVALAANWISGTFGRWCAVFVMAGGIGNLIDRILYGYVQDMFMFEFVDFAIFNVADIFISVFCILFIGYLLFGGEGKKARSRRDEDEFYDEESKLLEEEPTPRRRTSKRDTREEEQNLDTYEDNSRASRRSARGASAEQEEFPVSRRSTRSPVEDEANSTPAVSASRRNADEEYAQYLSEKRSARRAADSDVQPFRTIRTPEPSPSRRAAKSDDNVQFTFSRKESARMISEIQEIQQTEGRQDPSARTVPTSADSKPAPVRTSSSTPERKMPSVQPSVPVKEDEFNLDDILAEFH